VDKSLNDEWFSQIEEHLKCAEQNWLLGAGISFDANLPLMNSLTNKVKKEIEAEHAELYSKIIDPLVNELPNDFHIEHVLSHLGDYAALADRSSGKAVSLNGDVVKLTELEEVHEYILKSISETIRFGYVEGKGERPEQEGSLESPIVCVNSHVDFVDVLFNYSQAGISERRKPINLFTTNYDTLLEDAMALKRILYWDGFSCGAVAFRTLKYGDDFPANGFRANLVKIHGSIDWYLCEKNHIWRVRENDSYPDKKKRVLIYPQATKYIATQQDPFSTQFDLFRKSLNSSNSNLLAVCGYSFGDEHINNEIEVAMSKQNNETVLLAFLECSEAIPACLEKWRSSDFGQNIFILTLKGLYVGKEGPFPRVDGDDFWWTFKGMTDILKNGCEV